MRFFSKTRLVSAGLAALVLFWLHAPLAVYTALSPDKTFEPGTRGEIEVFRYMLLALAACLFLAASVWHGVRQGKWYSSVADDFCQYREKARSFDSLVNRPGFVAAWSGVMVAVFLGLFATVRLSFAYQENGVGWYDMLALEDGIWEMLTALSLLAAGVVLLLGVVKHRRAVGLCRLWIPIGLGVLFCLAAGEEMSWGQRWLGYKTPEVVKSINVQEEFTIHNMGGRWANQVMILFFLGYIGLAPIMGGLFVDVRYLFDRLNIPLAPIWFVPWAMIGVLFDERAFFSRLWGNPPWYLDEARETLFGVVMLGVMMHTALTWKKMKIQEN